MPSLEEKERESGRNRDLPLIVAQSQEEGKPRRGEGGSPLASSSETISIYWKPAREVGKEGSYGGENHVKKSSRTREEKKGGRGKGRVSWSSTIVSISPVVFN